MRIEAAVYIRILAHQAYLLRREDAEIVVKHSSRDLQLSESFD